MKKMTLLLLTSASLLFSAMVFAESTNPNDVLQTIPGAADKSAIGDTSPSKTTTTTTTVHKASTHKAKKHSAKKSSKKSKKSPPKKHSKTKKKS